MISDTYRLLKEDYGYTLTMEELSEVIDLSVSTIYRRIKLGGVGIPPMKKTGKSIKNRVTFPTGGVAKYLDCEEDGLENIS